MHSFKKLFFIYLGGIFIFAGLTSFESNVTDLDASKTIKVISGRVTHYNTNEPLEGVTITIKGTQSISGTQADGIFYMEVNDENTILVFSLDGFESKEVILKGVKEFDIQIKPKP